MEISQLDKNQINKDEFRIWASQLVVGGGSIPGGRPGRPVRTGLAGCLIELSGRDEVKDETARFRITHDRVTSVEGVGVFGLDFCHGVHDGVGNVGSALVAGENGVNGGECAAGLDAIDNARYLRAALMKNELELPM